jgi:hypothetical protein
MRESTAVTDIPNANKRRNSISGQFSARLIEMLESPAYRVLSRSAHMVISRIEVELAHHGGNDNDRLIVTTEDFIAYGMDGGCVAPALREAEALGFIRYKRGRGGNAEHRTPSMFGTTFSQHRNSRRNPPTDDWRRIKTVEEAEQIARDARNAKDQRAVHYGKRSAQKRKQKTKAGWGKPRPPVGETPTEKTQSPVGETPTTGAVGKPQPLSISRGEMSQGASAQPALAHKALAGCAPAPPAPVSCRLLL